jgi:hypothetical protein
MNLGKVTRGTAIVVLAASAFVANAQSASFWWNKQGDASNLMPATVDVVAGQTITLSVYLSTSGFSNNIANVSTMFGFDSATSTGSGATPAGSGLSVAHGGTNAAPTGIPITYGSNFAGGAELNTFGGGWDTTAAARPFGLWTSTGKFTGDFGFSNTAAVKVFDIAVTVSNSLAVGSVRPITLYASPQFVGSINGNWDSSVSDTNTLMAFPQSYVANLRVVDPVPEPASMAALGLGVVALIKRRKK